MNQEPEKPRDGGTPLTYTESFDLRDIGENGGIEQDDQLVRASFAETLERKTQEQERVIGRLQTLLQEVDDAHDSNSTRRIVSSLIGVREALSGSMVADSWGPIEDIPKDGSPVLVWAEPMSRPDIAWHEATGSTMRAYTHFMPLPKPPVATDAGGLGG